MSNVIEFKFGAKKQNGMKAAQYIRDIDRTRRQPYEQKFANFHKLCDDASSGDFDVVLVSFPEVLGDSYDELVSNLLYASKAGLLVAVADANSDNTH